LKETILLVDDELSYLELLKSILQQEGYSNVITESNPLHVPAILKNEKIDLILLDIYMPQMNGLQLLEQITPEYPNIPVIIVTAVDDKEIALEAIKFGAYEFIIKPPDTDRLLLTIRRAIGYKLLERERDVLRSEGAVPKADENKFSNIITDSETMHRVFNLVEIFAPTNETILIVGETGTGKDLVAKKVHDLSPRKERPYVAVNLASISPTLFESELFGTVKGSFTGSTNDKQGYFEAANGGTIFLDEVGELEMLLQAKLLRVIQQKEFERAGGTELIKSDVRIISATNRDLKKAVENKEFREDLYYRLNSFPISIPPIRHRRSDILILAEHFVQKFSAKLQKSTKGFSKRALKLIYEYNWPGNVRELENTIERCLIITDRDTIDVDDLPAHLRSGESSAGVEYTGPLFSDETVIPFEKLKEEAIRHALNITSGNIVEAAKKLQLGSATIYRLMDKYKIENRSTE